MQKRYFADLFAGSGGLSLGLEQAGFSPILVNEINKSAMQTYLSNRDHLFPWLREKYHVYDSADLITGERGILPPLVRGFRQDFGVDIDGGDLDLLVGGPPCQGFSTIGHRRSYPSHRQDIASNHLYLHMVTLIGLLKPKIFLFENVLGMTTAKWTATGKNGEVWEDVLKAFQSIKGYVAVPQVVHAKDYGVPQNRPRILIVGMREDLRLSALCGPVAGGMLPPPTSPAPDLIDLLSDLIDDDYENGGNTPQYPRSPATPIQREMRLDPFTGLVYTEGAPLWEQKYSHHTPKVAERFSRMIASNGAIEAEYRTKKFAQRVLVPRWDHRGPYITVTSLPDDYVHFSQPRTPTVREWARMQTFPDWYQFHGNRTTGGIQRAGSPRTGILDRAVPKYTQIGNAVPVAMARAIGSHFWSILERQDSPASKPSSVE